MSNKYDIEDLINSVVETKPVEFDNIFKEMLVDRIRSAVENRKSAIAQGMFTPHQQEQEE